MSGFGLAVSARRVGWPVRVGLSALVTAAFVAAVLFGSGRDSPPDVQTWTVVAAAEDWLGGEPVGGFDVVEVSGPAGALLAAPIDLDGQVPVSAVPAGALVSKSMLGPDDSPRRADSALVRLGVDTSVWGSGTPGAGDWAVFAARFGGCAAAVVELAGAGEGSVLVEASPELAARLGALQRPLVWEAPQSGWPECSQPGYSIIGDEAVCDDADGTWDPAAGVCGG